MKKELIVGICRFSFLGVGDWRVYRQSKDTSPERLEKIAKSLYDEARMEARFRAFEQICLPSILAQTDPEFLFIILSSSRMPEHMRNRLIEMCRPYEKIEILWSDKTDTNEALEETLRHLHDIADGNLWQFRLDDDDAIDIRYIERLRSHFRRLKGIPECGISTARGLYVVLYEGTETQYLEYEVPFHGAGAAAKLLRPGRSIYSFPHLRIRDHITSFVDFQAFGSLILKWPSDSNKLNLQNFSQKIRKIDQVRKMEPFEYEKKIRNNFPFLQRVDFDSLRLPQALPQNEIMNYSDDE